MADINPVYIWLLVGVVLVALEILGISGVGFLFAGLGALTVGAAIDLHWLSADATVYQFVLCFAAAAVWTALLWIPIKRHRQHGRRDYSNIIGDTAYVGSNGITKKKGGEATWSGTIMKAQLAPDAHIDSLEAGAQVTIVGITGATLIVKPKH